MTNHVCLSAGGRRLLCVRGQFHRPGCDFKLLKNRVYMSVGACRTQTNGADNVLPAGSVGLKAPVAKNRNFYQVPEYRVSVCNI
ncbi:hypothetical protein GGR01_002373 [Acetobacter oeni]|nr:hypothetical protein [Acetobacter oeni]